MATLTLTGLSKTYSGQVPVEALRDVSVTIGPGEYVAIEGPSGSGKSTLLNVVALLDTPTAGEYRIDDVSTVALGDAERARLRSATFAFVFQSFHLLDGRSVLDNVALGTLYRALPATRRRELARESLGFVGLGHKAGQNTSTLSGGERQRVAIARAIASGAPVVVADEPTGNLDQATGAQVMDSLERLNASGATVIVVTHDVALAARARRRLHVLDGHLTDQGAGGHGGGDGDGDEQASSSAPQPEGRDSRVRLADGLADAWKGLWTKSFRTLALVASVALGVGLALTTAGLSQTARYQVSDIFDAQRNQRVAMTSAGITPGTAASQQATSPDSLARVRDLAGVRAAVVLVSHDQVSVTTTPPGSTASESAAGPPGYDLVGVVDGGLPSEIVTMDTQGALLTELGPDEVVLGAQAARRLDLGPLLASPSVWIDGVPRRVVGVLTDAGLQVGLLNAVIVPEQDAGSMGEPRYASVEIKVDSGAAAQVAGQAPVAWIPAAPESVSVDAPPDPTTLRDTIESNLATMLLTLTGVALLAAVLSLTNSMTTAVFQRVGEFGLRRAIGARRVHVTGLVLTESLAIGVLGGVLGVYASVLLILGVTIARHWQPVLDPAMIPVGLAGGVVVGLLGGLLATHRAARIEPSDALRS